MPPGPNPHRLFPKVGVAVDPPDGSGTKSLRTSFSHIKLESKNPREANSPGVFSLPIRLDQLITEDEGQKAFPQNNIEKNRFILPRFSCPASYVFVAFDDRPVGSPIARRW